MAKKVAVLAVNPVNGCGLFQYLEAFFENGISYKVFAVSDTKEIKTNSGMVLIVDDVIANLKGMKTNLMHLYSPVEMQYLYSSSMQTSHTMWT